MFLCLDQCTTTLDSQFKDFNDVLLLTVDDTEFNEAQKILKNVEIPSKKDESEKTRCFGEIGRNKVTLLKVPNFGKTSTSSGHDVLVYETIQELKPKAIVSLGVCDGVRKEARFLGDVVVSSQVKFTFLSNRRTVCQIFIVQRMTAIWDWCVCSTVGNLRGLVPVKM
jgi:hypothetical protein